VIGWGGVPGSRGELALVCSRLILSKKNVNQEERLMGRPDCVKGGPLGVSQKQKKIYKQVASSANGRRGL